MRVAIPRPACLALALAVALPFVAAAQSFGITRDENGRLMPTGVPSPPIANTDSRGIYPGQIMPPTIEPNRTEFAEQARQRQNEVSRVMAEEKAAKVRGASTDAHGLTMREQLLLAELAREDREVRIHELAHFYTGRPYTAEPEYWFVVGPLGKRFAVAGHVRFDLTPISGDLSATVKKYEALRRAARAPVTPSPYDLKVATELDRAIAKLQAELSDAR